MDALAKKKTTVEVGRWKKSVVNHLYWCGSTSTSKEEVVAKWSSVVNHVHNVHDHDSVHFPKCVHPPLEQPREWLRPSKYSLMDVDVGCNGFCYREASIGLRRGLHPCPGVHGPAHLPEMRAFNPGFIICHFLFRIGTAASVRLQEVLLNKKFVNDMEKISPQYHTSAIESFHSLIIKFAPKSLAFGFIGMLCRYVMRDTHSP